MSVSKEEAIQEIRKSFEIVRKKAPMLKGIVDALETSIITIVKAIRTD